MLAISSTDPLIKVVAVTKDIATPATKLHILREINLSVTGGDTVALMGVSGSGKTTLLTLLAGLDEPSSGAIFFAGNEITKLSKEQCALLRRQYISFIFQDFQLISSLTALENVMLPLELQGIGDAKKQALAYLEKVNLSARLNHFPQQLSGGEQQRVAIARAFVTKPKLLLADEPTGNLDEATAETVVNLLLELNLEESTTLVIATHDPKLAEQCKIKYHLQQGSIYAA